MSPRHPHLAPPDHPERRVYVNASLRLEGIVAIGFDMDYTLAVYDETVLEELAFRLAAPHLEDMGYPPIAAALRYRPGRGIRGLVVDLERGNVLKVDQYDYVSIAWHGAHELPAAERSATYANVRIDLYLDRFESVDTLFTLPNLDLFAQLVALRDAHPGDFQDRGYARIWTDIREAIDRVHQDQSLKQEVATAPERYLVQDPELPTALRALREQGKRLFLLTNSELDYTDALMGHLLTDRDPELPAWWDYFDDVVVHARKPGFFTKDLVSRPQDTRVLAAGGTREIRAGGNFHELHTRLGCSGQQILFVGDHIFGDVIRSKRDLHWRTLMILPELGDELTGLEQVQRRRRRFLELLDQIDASDEAAAVLRNRLVDARLAADLAAEARLAEDYAATVARGRALQEELDALERAIDRSFHPRWGALLSDGGEVSRFGRQVLEFADMYASRVPNLARYPPGKYFQSPWDVLPHSRRI